MKWRAIFKRKATTFNDNERQRTRVVEFLARDESEARTVAHAEAQRLGMVRYFDLEKLRRA